MADDRHPVDVVADELVRTYQAAARRLEGLVRDALRRGLDPRRLNTPGQRRGDATTAYRARQLAAARAILADLERNGAAMASTVAQRAYASSIFALDHVLGDDLSLDVRFGGIHQRQVAELAANFDRSLRVAVGATGSNLEAVFARADLLDGALPAGGLRDFPRFIGRREDDVWRRFALETLAVGTVAGETRRQMSDALHRRLLDEGVTDALTGFVDRSGRRWPLDVYTEMVARTTPREAASSALIARMNEHGTDLVKVTAHPHKADVCSPYDGKTFSLSGADTRYPRLEERPPFHPRCRHVLGPAGEDLLAAYERELGITAEHVATPGTPLINPYKVRRDVLTEAPPQARPRLNIGNRPDLRPVGPERRPLSARSTPSVDEQTAARLEAQRIAELVAGDPGPELEAAQAWAKSVDKVGRLDRKRLNLVMGEDLTKWVDSAFGKRLELRQRLMRGDMTIDEAHDVVEEEWSRREYARSKRELAKQDNAFQQRSIPCFHCGRLKRRPSDVCQSCGDDPTTGIVNGDVHQQAAAHAFNRSHGFAY